MKEKKSEMLLLIVLLGGCFFNLNYFTQCSSRVELDTIICSCTQKQLNLLELGQIITGGVAYDIEVVDRIAYVADSQNGLVIVDVSDSNDPKLITSLKDGIGNPQDITINEDLAFIADGSEGLKIVDISNPSYPTIVGAYYDGGYAYGMSVMGNYALIADGEDGLEVIDIRTPENPTEIAGYYISGIYKEITLKDDIACISNCVISEGILQYSELCILDISDLTNISEVDVIDPGDGNGFFYAYISESFGYFTLHGQNMRIILIDFSDNSNPTIVGQYDVRSGGVPNKMHVMDDILYLAAGAAGLLLVNVSNPINPYEVTQFFDGGYAYDVEVIDNLAYVADRLDGLEIIQLYSKDETSISNSTSGFGLFISFYFVIFYFLKKNRRKS